MKYNDKESILDEFENGWIIDGDKSPKYQINIETGLGEGDTPIAVNTKKLTEEEKNTLNWYTILHSLYPNLNYRYPLVFRNNEYTKLEIASSVIVDGTEFKFFNMDSKKFNNLIKIIKGVI